MKPLITRLVFTVLCIALAGLAAYAANTLTSTITFNMSAEYSGPSTSLGTATDRVLLNRNIAFSNGSAADQCNLTYHAKVTLADANSTTLNVYDSGSLLDPLGNALTMAAVKFVYLKNLSTDASLLVGGGATPVALFADSSDILTLPPGGTFMFCAPSATGVVTTTNKNLKLEHNGTGSSSMDVEVLLLGVD